MFGNIGKTVVIGCLALPLALVAAETDSFKAAKADKELAAKIQKAVAKDDSLPQASRHVDVVVQNRVVTLKGTVGSDEESQAIQGKAESTVIQETHHQSAAETPRFEVDNELAVAPGN